MNDTEKSQLYSHLLAQHDKLGNQISSIKGESINLNENQIKEIGVLESRLRLIVESASRL